MKVGPTSFADCESEKHESGHRLELGPGGDVLQQSTPAQTDDVHEGECGDENESKEVRASERYSGKGGHDVLLRQDWKYFANVGGGSYGESCDGAAIGDGEEHPAVDKCDEIAVCLTQVNVLAARIGEHRAKFSKGEASEHGDHATENPDAK